MFQVTFLNEFTRLFFCENQYGEILSPSGELRQREEGDLDAVTEFASLNEALDFAHTQFEKWPKLYSAAVVDSESNETHRLFVDSQSENH